MIDEGGRGVEDRVVRVVLVDDQPLMTAGIRMILETDPGIRVVATATDGAAGIEQVRATRPDLVCMDIQMPGVDGLSATRTLVADPDLDCAVLMLTAFRSEDHLVAALQAGASGYLLKNTPPERLIAAVHSAAAGDALVAPELTGALIRRALLGEGVGGGGWDISADRDAGTGTTAHPDAGASRQAGTADAMGVPDGSGGADEAASGHLPVLPHGVELTPREEEVLRLVAEGLSNEEIADHLVLGRATVKTHVSNILMKLQVRDRVQAVVWAHRHGIVA